MGAGAGAGAEEFELPRSGAPWERRRLKRGKETAFGAYYRAQGLLGCAEGEWEECLAALRRPLPISVRICRARGRRAQAVRCEAEAERLLGTGAPPVDLGDGRLAPPARRLTWCGGWQLDCDKMALKYAQSASASAVQRWLVEHSHIGALTRQAVDSMVPAALLGVQPHHRVLDMCASPGSKTTQLLEALHAGEDAAGEGSGKRGGGMEAPAGFVVANDVDPKRAYMLVRRCMALGDACRNLIVTCHKAQKFPHLGPVGGSKDSVSHERAPAQDPGPPYPAGTFDRIVCDVPCSGDGTLRKNPQIWEQWTAEFAMGLHPLQLQIALRGAALLKVGGLMAYSTCSLNPVENEAVVAELLRRSGGALELVEAGPLLPDLAFHPGLETWKILTVGDDLQVQEHSSYDESQAAVAEPSLRRKFRPSLWPPTSGAGAEGHFLRKCLRILPHLNDTGGFFVALLRKTRDLPGPQPPREKQPETRATSPRASASRRSAPAENRYWAVPRAVTDRLRERFGLDDSLVDSLRPCLFSRSEAFRSVTCTSAPVAEACLRGPAAAALRPVFTGVTLFKWDRGTGDLELTQAGVEALGAGLGDHRRVTVTPSGLRKLLQALGRPTSLDKLGVAPGLATRGARDGESFAIECSGTGESGRVVTGLVARFHAEPPGLSVDLERRKGLEAAPRARIEDLLRALEAPDG